MTTTRWRQQVQVEPPRARFVEKRHGASEIERAIAAFARGSNGGLIVTEFAAAQVHRDLIITLAARHKLPAVYYERNFVVDGLTPTQHAARCVLKKQF
jgi:hypothetical protein